MMPRTAKRRIAARAKRRPARDASPQRVRLVESMDSALIYGILEGRTRKPVSENAIVFISLMSNLTPGISEVTYKHGVYIGRRLYSILRERKGYDMYEEAVGDLVRFFEQAGYSWITYYASNDYIKMEMRDRSREFIGMNLHGFEAGIISGFVTAARKQHVPIVETQCSNNGAPHCTFAVGMRKPASADAKQAIDRLASHIAKELGRKEEEIYMRASSKYYSMMLAPILDRRYRDQMSHIVSYTGAKIGEMLFGGKAPTGTRAVAYIDGAFRMLNLGKISVKSLKPISIAISFDSIHSSSEFVDVSLAFLNGLLRNHFVENAKVTRRQSRGSYTATVAGIRK